MNAQEAIKKVVDYKQTAEHIPYDVDKALSIVLKSAKFLHEDIVDSIDRGYYVYLYDANGQVIGVLSEEEAIALGIDTDN